MQRSKVLSIITIICFCSVILIPIGIALMWVSTKWKTILKSVLSAILGTLYIVLFVLFLLLEPSINTSGAALPFDYSKGKTEFNTEVPSNGKEVDVIEEEYKTQTNKSKKSKKKDEESKKLPRSLRMNKGTDLKKIIFPILFFIVIAIIIIMQNLRASKKKHGYENPYVDIDLYKLPLGKDSKIPTVHFLNIRLNQDERINFATETNQKNNEGNFVITSERVLIMNKELGVVEFPLEVLEAVSSISNSVIMLTSGTRKYYIFMPENQLRYALAILRWSYQMKTSE